jgi:hypothetical protein
MRSCAFAVMCACSVVRVCERTARTTPMPRSRRTRHTSLSGTAVSRAAGRESAADAQGADIEDRMRSTATSTPSGPAASSACLACSRVHPQISTIVSMLAAWSPYEVGGEAARTAKSTLTATEVGDATITLTRGEGEDSILTKRSGGRANVAKGRSGLLHTRTEHTSSRTTLLVIKKRETSRHWDSDTFVTIKVEISQPVGESTPLCTRIWWKYFLGFRKVSACSLKTYHAKSAQYCCMA